MNVNTHEPLSKPSSLRTSSSFCPAFLSGWKTKASRLAPRNTEGSVSKIRIHSLGSRLPVLGRKVWGLYETPYLHHDVRQPADLLMAGDDDDADDGGKVVMPLLSNN